MCTFNVTFIIVVLPSFLLYYDFYISVKLRDYNLKRQNHTFIKCNDKHTCINDFTIYFFVIIKSPCFFITTSTTIVSIVKLKKVQILITEMISSWIHKYIRTFFCNSHDVPKVQLTLSTQ